MPVVDGSLLCSNHLSKKLKTREIYKERVESGFCFRCENPSTEGHSTCEECRRVIKELSLANKAKKIEQGLCQYCGDKPLDTSRSCRKCHLKRFATQHGLTSNDWVTLDAIWNKQQGLCFYSKEPLFLGLNASLDHKIPISKGGTSDIDNLQWTTLAVNIMKRDLSEAEFILIIKSIANNF